MELTEETRRFLTRRAKESQPREACGFILADGTVIEMANVASNPERGFVMDQRELVERLSHCKDQIAAIWHSHPKESNKPSGGDFDTMRIPGCLERHWDYLIVTPHEVTHWDINQYAPVPDKFWEAFVA